MQSSKYTVGILTNNSSESSNDDDSDGDVPIPIDDTHSPVKVYSSMKWFQQIAMLKPVDLESSSSSVNQVASVAATVVEVQRYQCM